MARIAIGALLTLVLGALPRLAAGQDTPSAVPPIPIAAIDSDALTEVAKQLEIRGYTPREDGLDVALRAFAHDQDLDSPDEAGLVDPRTIDALGAGAAAALRWGGRGPRAPELTGEEIWRVNAALRLRGYSTREPRFAVDDDTLEALRAFQRDTGHPVQQGELIERRWLFILGVATDESVPRT